MGIGGIVLAAPRVVLAGEDKPKYTHVDKMYPWEGLALDEETSKKTPAFSDWVFIFEPKKSQLP
jgi:hypothetical protein